MNELDRKRRRADEFARLVDGDHDSPPEEFAAELRLVDHMRTAGKANPSPEFVATLRQRLIDEANGDRRDLAVVAPLRSRPRRGRLAVAVAATVLLAGGVAASAAMLTHPDPVACPGCAPLETPTTVPSRPPASTGPTTMPSQPTKTPAPNRPIPPTSVPVKPSARPTVPPSARPTTTPSPVLPSLPIPTPSVPLPSLPLPLPTRLPSLPLPSTGLPSLPIPLPTISIQLPELGSLDFTQERRMPHR